MILHNIKYDNKTNNYSIKYDCKRHSYDEFQVGNSKISGLPGLSGPDRAVRGSEVETKPRKFDLEIKCHPQNTK